MTLNDLQAHLKKNGLMLTVNKPAGTTMHHAVIVVSTASKADAGVSAGVSFEGRADSLKGAVEAALARLKTFGLRALREGPEKTRSRFGA